MRILASRLLPLTGLLQFETEGRVDLGQALCCARGPLRGACHYAVPRLSDGWGPDERQGRFTQSHRRTASMSDVSTGLVRKEQKPDTGMLPRSWTAWFKRWRRLMAADPMPLEPL